jgi:hypothetical protein
MTKIVEVILLDNIFGRIADASVISGKEFPIPLEEVLVIAQMKYPDMLFKIVKNHDGEWLFFQKFINPETQE